MSSLCLSPAECHPYLWHQEQSPSPASKSPGQGSLFPLALPLGPTQAPWPQSLLFCWCVSLTVLPLPKREHWFLPTRVAQGPEYLLGLALWPPSSQPSPWLSNWLPGLLLHPFSDAGPVSSFLFPICRGQDGPLAQPQPSTCQPVLCRGLIFLSCQKHPRPTCTWGIRRSPDKASWAGGLVVEEGLAGAPRGERSELLASRPPCSHPGLAKPACVAASSPQARLL